jgi:hypothetical protein
MRIPAGAHWRDVRAVTTHVGQALQNALRAIEQANQGQLYGIFGDAQWTNKERLSDATLRDLVEHFSSLTLSVANVPEDELGVAYEYLIKKFADDSGHTAAEFYTNRTVVQLMTLLLDPQEGESIYDPTAGSGGMLLSAAMQLKRQGQEWRTLRLYGQERNLITSAIARMNLFLHGFEDFRVERPEMPPNMEADLEPVIRLLAENRWPWRLHATYDQTIDRALNVFEKVNRDVPLTGINWFFDHAETISERNIDRIAALGGGIAVQHRMMYQGEYFIERYGAKAAENTPPIRKMIEAGVPGGAGTDATRVASYNPWVSLSWLVTSTTLGGTRLYPAANRLDRETALRLWTVDNTWFSNEQGKKGQIKPGQLADLALLSDDYFAIPEDQIVHLRAVLTVLGGKVVHGEGGFGPLAPALPAPMPDWSPVARFGGYYRTAALDDNRSKFAAACGCGTGCAVHGHDHAAALTDHVPALDARSFWGAVGCGCWAV